MTPHPQIEKRLEPVEPDEGKECKESGESSPKLGCTIFLGYTSNLISSGVRESIRYLAEHKMVQMYTLVIIVQVKVTLQVTSKTIDQFDRGTSLSESVLLHCVRWM